MLARVEELEMVVRLLLRWLAWPRITRLFAWMARSHGPASQLSFFFSG